MTYETIDSSKFYFDKTRVFEEIFQVKLCNVLTTECGQRILLCVGGKIRRLKLNLQEKTFQKIFKIFKTFLGLNEDDELHGKYIHKLKE